MSEILEESSGLESTTIGIYRTSATVKGGRRFSFSALVVVGDRNGSVGLGYGKAPGVPAAIEKAQNYARKSLKRVTLKEGTLPHAAKGTYGASGIKLLPASPGTGVIAGGTARAVLELAGVRDCLTKSVGSTNQKNLARAVFDGLLQLRSKETVEALRGVKLDNTRVEEVLEAGRRWAPQASAAPRPRVAKTAAPAGGKSGGKGRGGKGRGGKGRDRQESGDAAQSASGDGSAQS